MVTDTVRTATALATPTGRAAVTTQDVRAVDRPSHSHRAQPGSPQRCPVRRRHRRRHRRLRRTRLVSYQPRRTPHDTRRSKGKGKSCVSRLTLRPVTLSEARRFVAAHHRHNDPPITWRFGVGIQDGDELVGVAMAGLPKSRMLMQADPYLLEVNRTCTTGVKNANSMLYGAVARAAKALGYRRLITYTLTSESGSSLRAAGWTIDTQSDHDVKRWTSANGSHETLFGPTSRIPTGPKLRWVKELGNAA